MVDIYEQNPLQRLYAAGQSVWYDNIRRGVVLYGELEAMVAGDAVTGITSNPTIFHKAVTASAEYDQAIADLAREGLSADSFVVELASNDGYLLRNFVAMEIRVLGIDPARNVAEGTGGPFGAVLFGPDHRVLAAAVNRVVPHATSLAHAENMAYMLAQQRLHTPRLNDVVSPVVLAAFSGWNDAGDAASRDGRLHGQYLPAEAGAICERIEKGLDPHQTVRLQEYADNQPQPRRTDYRRKPAAADVAQVAQQQHRNHKHRCHALVALGEQHNP